MRKLLITLDDELDTWLSKEINQNEVVRKALKAYRVGGEVNTVEVLKEVVSRLENLRKLDTMEQSFKKLDRLISYMEKVLEI